MALFHKVRNSYSAVVAAQWLIGPVRMIIGISHLAQMHDIELHIGHGVGLTDTLKNLFVGFSCVFL